MTPLRSLSDPSPAPPNDVARGDAGPAPGAPRGAREAPGTRALGTMGPALRVAVIYGVAALAWILFGTALSAQTARGMADYEMTEMVKGALFVVLTSLLLFALLRREFAARGRLHTELARHSARLEDLADQTRAVLFTTDARGLLTSASKAAMALWGIPPEGLLGRSLADLVDPRQSEEVARRFRELIGSRAPLRNLSVHFPRADGVGVWAEINASASEFEGEPGAIGIARDVTERQRAEEVRRSSEEHQRELARQLGLERARLLEAQAVAKVGSWETDLDSLEVRWSAETHRIFETDPESFEPTHAAFLALVHPEDRARVDAAFLASLSRNQPESIEHRVVLSDGRVKVVEERWRVFRDEGARAGRALGTCRDITEPRRAQAELVESRRMLDDIINAMPARVFWKDRDLRYLGCNAAFARDAGYEDPSELIGKDDYEPAWRAQAELYRADDREVLATGRAKLLIEEPMTTPGGATRTLLTSKLPLRDAEGNITGVLGTYIDITDRKRAEEARAKLAAAVEQAAEAVVITDADGVIEYVNPAFERITGYSLAEARGQNPRFLKSGNHDAGFYREMWSTIVGGGVWRGRVTNRRKDGSLIEEDVTISAVRDPAGRTTNYVAVKHDVTRQVELQRELQEVQKREAIGRLAGGIAHDFNNLLTVINGYGDLLLNRLHPQDPLREWAEDIRQAGGRAAALTRQLLAFSRRQVLRPEVIDLNRVVADLEKMLRRLIGEDVVLATDLAADLGMVRADPGQMEQVLLNLAVNARDAMPRGGTLTVETRNLSVEGPAGSLPACRRPGEYIRVTVRDTGQGMDATTLAHVFEPFFTTKEAGKGTGLGLATVHGIVEQSGGYVTVESEVGRGSTFCVYLPRVAETAPCAARPVPWDESAPRGTETILLAEDQEDVRALARHVLQRCGYTVVDAGDGEEALEAAAAHPGPVHLLVSDVVMPRLGGRELAERFRVARPDCKVLFMSGYTDDAVIRHGVVEEEFAFLQKPFSATDLARRVRGVLDGV